MCRNKQAKNKLKNKLKNNFKKSLQKNKNTGIKRPFF